MQSIDIIKNHINQYDSDTDDVEESYDVFTIDCNKLFKEIARYLDILNKSELTSIKQKVSNSSDVAQQFNNIGLMAMNLIKLYGNIIEIYTKNLQYKVTTIKHDIDARKKLYYHDIAYQESIDRMLDEDSSSSEKIATNITMMFDKFGDLLNSGIDLLGKYVGDLFMKLGRGTEEVSYCVKIINEKGFDGFLDDPRCIACVRDAVVYGLIFLVVWSIVKSILRKVGNFLSWLGK